MTPFPLRGLVAAVHTPFRPDGSLWLDPVERQAAHLLAHGVETAFVAGTTGESHSLTFAERESLAERWAAVTRGSRLRVVVHVGANALADARALAAQAARLQLAAVSALAPSYFKPRSVAVLVESCAVVAAGAPELPFFYYDIPPLTGVHLPAADFLAAAADRIPNLAGLKFSHLDLAQFQQCLQARGGAFEVAWGCDEALLAALALGGRGAVGSTYNFLAPLAHRILRMFEAGDLAGARREQFRLLEVVQCLAAPGYLAASKWLMKRLGIDVGTTRLPLPPLDPTAERHLEEGLGRMGFFDWIR